MKIQSKWTIMGDEDTIMKIFKKIIFLVADLKKFDIYQFVLIKLHKNVPSNILFSYMQH
jgi:hypothetical protein